MASAASQSSSRAFRPVWAVGILGVVLTAMLATWFWFEARRLDQMRFDQITHRLVEDLDTHTEKVEAMLRDLQRLLNSRSNLSLLDWDEFIDQVSPTWNYPGVVAIGYATNHDTIRILGLLEPWLRDRHPVQRSEFYKSSDFLGSRHWSGSILDIYREGVSPAASFIGHERTYSITGAFHRAQFLGSKVQLFERSCQFEIQTHTNRGMLLLVGYPDEKGYNHIDQAIIRDEIQVLPRSALLRQTNGQPWFTPVMILSVTHPQLRESWLKLTPDRGWPSEGQWLRWQLNAGLIFACLDYRTTLRQIQGGVPAQVVVEIHSQKNPSRENWINPTVEQHPSKTRARPAFQRRHVWPMYRTAWSLVFHTTPVFDRESTRFRAWWAAAIGLAVTALFCWALVVQTRGRLLESGRAAELNDARNALQAAQQEKERLSHDLHDGAIQSLYAVQLGLSGVARDVETVAPATAQKLEDGRTSLDVVIGELREFITRVKRDTPGKPSAGLATVLDSLVRRLQPASRAVLQLRCDAESSQQLTSSQAIQLAAIAREALSNSLRHSQAGHITISLAGNNSTVTLEISDDGIGFDMARSLRTGMGLDTMKRRAQDLGAKLDIQTAPAKGTIVRLQVHAAEEQNDDDSHAKDRASIE